MWYHMIPTVGALMFCVTTGVWLAPRWILGALGPSGHTFGKDVLHNPTMQHFLRDERLSGNAYIALGLETVADVAPDTSAKSNCKSI